MKWLICGILPLLTNVALCQTTVGGGSSALAGQTQSVVHADQFPGIQIGEKIQNADTACAGNACGIFIGNLPAIHSTTNNFPSHPSATSKCIDFRPETNLVNYQVTTNGLNITDCKASSAWLSPNTGGLGNTLLWLGSTPPASAALTYPGSSTVGVFMQVPGGTWESGPSSAGSGGMAIIAQTSDGTNMIDNATSARPFAVDGLEVNTTLAGSGNWWDVYGITASIFQGSPPPKGFVNRLLGLAYAGNFFNTNDVHAAFSAGFYATSPALNSTQLTPKGIVKLSSCGASSCTVTWVNGDKFGAAMTAGLITLGSYGTFPVFSVTQPPTSTPTLTIGCNYPYPACPAGQAEVAFAFKGRAYSAVFEGNQLFTCLNPAENPHALCTPDPAGGGGIMFDLASGANDPSQKIWIRDRSYSPGWPSDPTQDRKAIDVGGGGNGVWGSLRIWDHSGRIKLLTVSDTGDVNIRGNLTKGSGGFKIDHPLDPADKYLYHSFVESPDMMNIYNGNVVLDANGEAEVHLPDWFEALNRDFRYQLTCIGGFAPVYVSREIENNRFRIAGGVPGLKVSWQVTGIRQDAYANAHRIPVEEEKQPSELGHYLHPELFGSVEHGAAPGVVHGN